MTKLNHPSSTNHDDWYEVAHIQLKKKPGGASEADIEQVLIRPVLEKVLGYRIEDIDSNTVISVERSIPTYGNLRPDFTCRRNGEVSLILEVKRFGVDLLKRAGKGWETAPLGQLQRYLKRMRGIKNTTWGIVTNGDEWIVVPQNNGIVEEFITRDAIRCVRTLSDLRSTLYDVISSVQDSPVTSTQKEESNKGDWLEIASECASAKDFIRKVAGYNNVDIRSSQTDAWLRLEGREYIADSLFPVQSHIAALEFNFPDRFIAPADISHRLSEIEDLSCSDVIGVAFVGIENKEAPRQCRAFVLSKQILHTTALIEPNLPGPRAEDQFIKISNTWSKESWQPATIALSTAPLQKQFHEEIARWFEGTDSSENTLRHLIQVMFVWLLCQRGIVLDNALWEQTRKPSCEHEVHNHILWLFTEVLANPKKKRRKTDDEWKNDLVARTPFLNGSLFAALSQEQEPQRLKNCNYLNSDGLFAILGRYDWTLHDCTGYASETALDPKMLGDMFEQLMLHIEGPRIEGKNLKMPHGTYYTPQDIAEEMVVDALATWLSAQFPSVGYFQLRRVLHPSPSEKVWHEWDSETVGKLLSALSKTTILDPCCGSGVFVVATLQSLCRARCRLAETSNETLDQAEIFEEIIEKQINAVDIHPLAILITRLRLFITLIDSRSRGSGNDRIKPLPNLETRCLTANTLCVELGRRNFGELNLDNLRAAKEMWTVAHDPDQKDWARELEKEARLEILQQAKADAWDTDEDIQWLNINFLSNHSKPAQYDIRKLFPAPAKGYDIVIGNPPYQKPDKLDGERGERLGYAGGRTNTYLMFIEAALELIGSAGVVTFVVPHSIVFGRQKAFRDVRSKIREIACEVALRTYDNRLKPLFPSLDWLKSNQQGKENRQRATVLTVLKAKNLSTSNPTSPRGMVLRSAGLIRLNASDRHEILRHAVRGVKQPDIQQQWSQAPTVELRTLLTAMLRGAPAMLTRTRIVTFPPTAMYFISCLPQDCLAVPWTVRNNLGRKPYQLNDDETSWPWIGLFNSHLFHAYWLMIGDAFHVTTEEIKTINAPDGWSKETLRAEIEKVAKSLLHRDTLSSCEVTFRGKNNTEWGNINFHKEGSLGPPIIEKLDILLLEAYGLELEADPLMEQMRTIRTGSAHSVWNT
ncbi:MAG: Eco57I restriction-modification methylase domain-containing protein [Aestuariivita sp.]|nr:Eco57I restriction-modification methylase domain-containing protein [Aestuariivita sp.]